jgi:hypothetical protein
MLRLGKIVGVATDPPRTMELPVGLMITGWHFEYTTVLHTAHAYEQD